MVRLTAHEINFAAEKPSVGRVSKELAMVRDSEPRNPNVASEE